MGTYTKTSHNRAIWELAGQVTTFHASKIPFRIDHGSTNSTRTRDPSTPALNISHLNHILSIDKNTFTAVVEPNVPLDALLTGTLKHGLMPPVVMEFPGITVGGGFSGASGESSCWKEGLFDCCITEIEVILGDGRIVRAEKGGLNADLFESARCSLGTLGVVTLLKVRLIEAKKYVELTYHRTGSVQEHIDMLERLCDDKEKSLDLQFIEGILFSPTHGTVITGRMVSKLDRSLPFQRFDRATSPWYYRHAKGTPSPTHTEIVPIESYLFRYDRGAFWTAESFFDYWKIPSNKFTRTIANPLLKTRAVYRGMHACGGPEESIVQDLMLPIKSSVKFVEYVKNELDIWPLWVCPIRRKGEAWGSPFWKIKKQKEIEKKSHSELTHSAGELTINFGVWGGMFEDPKEFRKVNRRMEEVLRELHGMKVLYAYSFYTEDEFWNLYDKQHYEAMRRKWGAEALPSVWDKIKRKEAKPIDIHPAILSVLQIWPLGGLYTGWIALFG
ncbi:24-dehydrocholesterol reductase-like protein precursor [Massariosphaeria phaeospora]|uniref:Delta(24)-sterol reductase n=1 Tax=Massariosphaeria phaeospora TaxID=100035 RepID=A0A7C8I493_9PLEO|nr:24-dehydrocholesterol reductase-like protein precursor [Massariosphaeria phaeospora]